MNLFMNLFLIIIGLLFIGILAFYGGELVERLKLPSLIGMIIVGMVIGPSFIDIVPKVTIKISPYIKDLALVTVLFIGGLGISMEQMKKIGRPAILLSIVPATLEGLTIAYFSTIFLKFSFVQGAILGFIIAAVSPAVLVPSMVSLIEKKIGEDKAIPQMLLVGASADDTIAITLFTTFLGIYIESSKGQSISILNQVILIPITLILSVAIGYIIAKLTRIIFMYIKMDMLKVIITFLVCLSMREIENLLHISLFNSLLTIMIYGFFLRSYFKDTAKIILNYMNKIWKVGKIYLFAFVGMAINPMLVGEYLGIGLKLLLISLSIRSIGVLISLIGTELNVKERIFCVIAYLPKATVQSAKAGIPLQMGVLGGEIMQAIAILSVLITAPIGSIGIRITSKKFLKKL
ncbi:cation:proton antiporter [Hathewaya limosa]|uniref:NhaP-type Na+/H+ or K+/H+ antiporter n=1 Tax=Hathewaya limosa TaxID=1536 RepID=A0ABU0JR66_HATLI|nr:cation:proton antiporter [Hathewaya limosa]MDQ0479587.1 NhaP-type Na+/H+ or K+/H+ antiporter [Hathewaya limosa]